jgi:hypothetical protein
MIELLWNIVAFVAANYIPFILFYIVGGALYAVLKWVIQLRKLSNAIKAEPSGYNRNLLVQKYFSYGSYPPKAEDNKALIFAWATLWPINLLWTLFADVAKEAWNTLYRHYGRIFDKLAEKILPPKLKDEG